MDAFSKIRSEEDSARQDLRNFCLVCSLDRYTLERIHGFDYHTQEEHSRSSPHLIVSVGLLQRARCRWAFLHYIVRLYKVHRVPAGTTSEQPLPQTKPLNMMENMKEHRTGMMNYVMSELDRLEVSDVNVITRRAPKLPRKASRP